MKILTLGWEIVPFFAGGLGIVCTELTRSLVQKGIDVTFCMPYGPKDLKPSFLNHLIVAEHAPALPNNVDIAMVIPMLYPYATKESYRERYDQYGSKKGKRRATLYGPDLLEEMFHFAARVTELVNPDDFDLIHAHDWTTFPAGAVLKRLFKKPLVVHVHITEFDKSGGMHADPKIFKIEQEGMLAADMVITVSGFMRDTCTKRYLIPEDKITVVHNAPVPMREAKPHQPASYKTTDKIVMFAGRITLQKGPDYFVEAARYILEKRDDVTFIIAGSGDMLPQLISRAGELGILHKFIFTGYYTREQAEVLFEMADVFVMPSVSEPFGLVAYEALIKKTPLIISRQSGVSEVLNHCLKVDFWDVKRMASKILAILEYPSLDQELSESGYREAKQTSWEALADKCIDIYTAVLKKHGGKEQVRP